MASAHPMISPTYTLGSAPGGLPLLGHALKMLRDPLDFLPSLRAHGDLVRLRLGPQQAYMACSHPIVQQVLLNSRTFDKGGEFIDKMRLILGNGVGTCNWQAHTRQRRLLQPAFHRARQTAYAGVMLEEVIALTDSWHRGDVVDVNRAFHGLTTRVTARTLFSTEIGADAVTEVQRSFPIVWDGLYQRMINPVSLVHRMPTAKNRRFNLGLKRLNAVISEIIEAYREAGTNSGDMLSMLLAARDQETGDRLSSSQIRDEVMTMLVAGTETTATGLAWTMHLLGKHPEVEQRLHEEIDGALGGRPPAIDHASRLPYVQRVILESLRLHPPVWLVTRVTTSDTELGGHPIPSGTTIVFSPYALHRDPSLFEDPERFDPDRWLPERISSLPRNPSIAFGGGKRKCIGDTLALQESVIALATIGSRWRLSAVPGSVVKAVPRANLSPGPLPMIVEPRH